MAGALASCVESNNGPGPPITDCKPRADKLAKQQHRLQGKHKLSPATHSGKMGEPPFLLAFDLAEQTVSANMGANQKKPCLSFSSSELSSPRLRFERVTSYKKTI